MTPAAGDILEKKFKTAAQPSKTFQLDTEHKRIIGMVDGLEAVRQAVYCILNTERFEWLIYSWNYGAELQGLFGKPMNLAKAKIKKRIREALLQDDRIESVDSFVLTSQGRKLSVTFMVHTASGEFKAEKEVNI